MRQSKNIILTQEQFSFIENKIDNLLQCVHEAQRELGLITEKERPANEIAN